MGTSSIPPGSSHISQTTQLCLSIAVSVGKYAFLTPRPRADLQKLCSRSWVVKPWQFRHHKIGPAMCRPRPHGVKSTFNSEARISRSETRPSCATAEQQKSLMPRLAPSTLPAHWSILPMTAVALLYSTGYGHMRWLALSLSSTNYSLKLEDYRGIYFV